jgi:hypothetical protein
VEKVLTYQCHLKTLDLMSLQIRMSVRWELLANRRKGSSWVPTKTGMDITTDSKTKRIEQRPDIRVLNCCLLG